MRLVSEHAGEYQRVVSVSVSVSVSGAVAQQLGVSRESVLSTTCENWAVVDG